MNYTKPAPATRRPSRVLPTAISLLAASLLVVACGDNSAGPPPDFGTDADVVNDTSSHDPGTLDPGVEDTGVTAPDSVQDDGSAADPGEDAPPDAVDQGAEEVCTPNCDGRQCGDDGCGGTCGACEDFPNSYCDEDGFCACEANCTDRVCGDDGCGGACGECGVALACSDNGLCDSVECVSDLTCQPYQAVCDPLSKTCVPCLGPNDCPDGSFVCLDLQCTEVTFCSSSLDCTEQVCDPTRGYCVDCAEDIDCGENALCRGGGCHSVTPCNSSLDCTAQVCNKTKGYCVNCIADTDCGTNSECLNDVCVPYTPCSSDLACTPLGQLCDKAGGRCVRCLEDIHCPDVYHCRDKQCALDVCVPESGSCDGNIAVQCLGNGSGFANPVPCLANQYCEGGTCHDQVCAPNSSTCNGNVLETCNWNGSGLAESRNCTSTAVCLDGACVPKICVPQEKKCSTDFSWIECNVHGTTWGNEIPCGEDMYCEAGGCKDQVCFPSESFCNENVVETCNATGSGLASTLVCGDTAACIAGECVPKICEPFALRCKTDYSWQQCNVYGTTWSNQTSCLDGSYCNEGSCLAQSCEPGMPYCQDDDTGAVCDSRGSGPAVTLPCGQDATCLLGVCLPAVCTPGDRFCSEDGLAVCNPEGTGYVSVPCEDNQYCADGACLDRICIPDELVCDEGLLLRCNSQGSDTVLVEDCNTAEDGNPCTDSFCNAESGGCGTTFNTAACDDGDACTEGDHCELGVCIEGTLKDCQDGDACTYDSCVEGECVHAPRLGRALADVGSIRGVLPREDGRFLLVATTIPPEGQDSDIWAAMALPDSSFEWQEKFGDSTDQVAVHAATGPSNSLIVLSQEVSGGNTSVGLHARDSHGNPLWNSVYGGDLTDGAWSVVAVPDGYVVSAYSFSFGAGMSDAWVFRTDPGGRVIWTKTYGGTDKESARGLMAVDSGFVFTGIKRSGDYDGWLVRLDDSGEVLWSKTYGSAAGNEMGNAITATTSGGFAVAGRGVNAALNSVEGWLLITDASGKEVTQKTLGVSGWDEFRDVVLMPNGGYSLGGWFGGASESSLGVPWVVRTDDKGAVSWSWSADGGTAGAVFRLVSTGEGGLLVAGTLGGGKAFWTYLNADGQECAAARR